MNRDKIFNLFRAPNHDPSAVLHVQIAQQVREVIRSNALPPGCRLPSMRSLAKEWNANTMTVHQALTVLEKEGLVISRHGKGTFVRERARNLRAVGVYYYADNLAHPEKRFMRAVHQCLLNRIEASGMRGEVWNDPRPEEDRQPWPALVEATRHGDIDAVISPSIDDSHVDWLSKLPVPVAFIGARSQQNSVSFDNSQMARLAVDALARQGCRSIGLVSALPACICKEDQTAEDLVLFNTFMAEVQRRGLATQDAWIITLDRLSRTPLMSREEWGYKAFMQIWNQPDHPDGLVVVHDAETLGVTMAILEHGVRVPEELRLVYHKHAEVDLFCPFPVNRVVSKADDIAAALLDLVKRESAGEKVESTVLEFAFEKMEDDEAVRGAGKRQAAMAAV